jgi:hypothetical protein
MPVSRPRAPRTALDPDTLVPYSELPGIFHRSRQTIDRWLRDGVLTRVKVSKSVYVRRDEIDAMLAPARAVRAQLREAEAAGQPVLNPEQLALVRRALGDALDALIVADGKKDSDSARNTDTEAGGADAA